MERNHSQKASCRIHHYVIDEGVRTGKLQDFRKITHTHKKCGISMFVQKDSLKRVKVLIRKPMTLMYQDPKASSPQSWGFMTTE